MRCFSSQRYRHSLFLVIFTTVSSSHVDSPIAEYLYWGANCSFTTNQMVLSWRVCEIAACSTCDHQKRRKHFTRVYESRFAFRQVCFIFIEDPTNTFWLIVYGIITFLLKKLLVLAFWVIEVNVQDAEVCIVDGTEETTQSAISLHVDSLSFHRYQDANDSWKQLTISSVSVTYSSNIAKSTFLLAHFPNDLILRVYVVFVSRIDRITHSLSKQPDDHPHSIFFFFFSP